MQTSNDDLAKMIAKLQLSMDSQMIGLKQEVREFKTLFNNNLAALNKKVDGFTNKFNSELIALKSEVNEKVSTKKYRNDSININVKLNKLENEVRKGDLLLTGIPENPSENLKDIFLKICTLTKYSVPSFDIFRIKKNKSQGLSGGRSLPVNKFFASPIIVKLHSQSERIKFLKCFFAAAPVTLEKIGFTSKRAIGAFECLSSDALLIRKAAMKLKEEKKIHSVQSFNGVVVVKVNPTDQYVKINCLDDLNRMPVAVSAAAAASAMIRVQSPEGIKRIEISAKANIKDLYESIRNSMKVDEGFALFKERNLTKELMASRSQTINSSLKHGDMVYLKQIAGTSRRASTSVAEFPSHSEAAANTNLPKMNSKKNKEVEEDAVDEILSKTDGRIQRGRDNKLCRHNMNGCCVHCSPIEPYDDAYLKEQKIKHLSFHSFIRKQTSGIDRGKYVAIDDINCRIKPGCREHPPWPKGICSKCQPSAITLNRQIYRHVDNVMFENTTIVERFLNYWRSTGHQRMGFLYGTYEVHSDVPLGIRAKVAAIYEPPQESTRDSIKLLENDSTADIDDVARSLGLKMVGWIFTDLITEDPAAGTVKQIRGIETHFLTAQECIMAGQLQNSHPNPCKYSSNGVFGSKFVTICVTGDKTKQVHMEGYAVSAQCMALVRDDCLIPTKDAPELGYIRESTDKQYVPDVYYKEKDQYGNEVQRLARPLPVEYLLVDVPASTPLQPQYTFTQCDKKQPFPVENRYLDGHLQDFSALSTYLSHWSEDEFLEAISDFHLLIYLYKMDMLPMKAHMAELLEAVRLKDPNMANNFKKNEVWKVLESLIAASSDGSGGTASYPSQSTEEQGAEATSWTCNHCTFINRGDLSSCEICGLPR